MGQGRARIYNVISTIFLVLTIIVIAYVGLRMASPPVKAAQVAVALPTMIVLPSITPSFTPTFTPLPTQTSTSAPTLTPSITPTVTWTLVPTLTPSLTDTFAPGVTPPTSIPPATTAAPTLTPNSFTPPPTQSQFPFELRDHQVIYTNNFANTAGCSWQGIGGQVFDQSGNALAQVSVHVFGQGVDTFTTSGSNTLYGLSGWEVPLSTTVTSDSYVVELQSAQGVIVSPQIKVTFTADCAKNLALVNFDQTRPF